jgi:hypothetical protein
MATTNVQLWNPTQANQENDAAYLADSQRAGGAVNPALFDATLANKLFNQLSTYVFALFTAFANKGFTTSDSNVATLTAQCANFLTSADILAALQLIPFVSSISLNATQANGFYVEAMTGNLTITAVTGLTAGQIIALSLQQDATGGRTVTYPGIMVGAVQPDPTPNAVSVQLYQYDPVTSLLRAITPSVSNNGVVFSANVTLPTLLKAGAFTLNSPGSPGMVLTNVGGNFVPLAPARAPGTVTDFTGARSFGTTYQNTTGGAIYVSGCGFTNGSSVGSLTGLVGVSTPTLQVFGMEYTATVNSGQAGFGFMVPSGYFYTINATGAINGTSPVWTETQVS